MINLRLLWPAIKAVAADHIKVSFERGESILIIKVSVWAKKVTITAHTQIDKVVIAWTEAGQWQSKEFTYDQLQQRVAQELS